MHQAPGVRVEGVAPVHGAAVVPHHQVVGFPLLMSGEVGLGCVFPEPRQQILALVER